MTDATQARLQRIEDHLKNLDGTVFVLSAVGSGEAKQRIKDTFSMNPATVVVYRGVEKNMTQTAIASRLKQLGLPGADQGRVSNVCTELDELGFLRKTSAGHYAVVDGWGKFGLERVLKKTLKEANIDELK